MSTAEPAHLAEPRHEVVGARGTHGHQHLARHRALVGLAVDLLQQVLDQAGGVDLLDLLDHPPALAADPAAADVEDLDGRLQLVLGEGEHVGVGGVGQHDGRLLQRPLQRLDVVAQARRTLEVELGRRRAHRLLEAAARAGRWRRP